MVRCLPVCHCHLSCQGEIVSPLPPAHTLPSQSVHSSTLRMAPMTCHALREVLADVLRIDADIMGERWEERHFLSELPGKWECSILAFEQGQVVGYAVT